MLKSEKIRQLKSLNGEIEKMAKDNSVTGEDMMLFLIEKLDKEVLAEYMMFLQVQARDYLTGGFKIGFFVGIALATIVIFTTLAILY